MEKSSASMSSCKCACGCTHAAQIANGICLSCANEVHLSSTEGSEELGQKYPNRIPRKPLATPLQARPVDNELYMRMRVPP